MFPVARPSSSGFEKRLAMTRETLLDGVPGAAAPGTSPAHAMAPATGQGPDAKTFVLVHGGFHGGWCWGRVAGLLRARGHAVHTPTQTGCGERSHLLSRSITLDTFVDDIANVLRWEDLHRVVLVGHSFGGIAITGVADRMPERLRQLVYLDALILDNGESVFGQFAPEVMRARMRAAEPSGGLSIEPLPASAFGIRDPVQAEFVQARLTSHPLGAYTSPLRLAHPVAHGVAAVYVRCTDPPFAGVQPSYNRAVAHGMKTVDFDAAHDAMITAPERLADLLVRLSA